MNFADTISLALRNLRQAKLRTFLTTLGVSIGIASLTGMVSFGVGLQEQLVGRFTRSGMFDSVTVTTATLPARLGGPGRGRGGRGGQPADAGTSRPKLDDAAIAKFAALPDVTSVYPVLRVPVQIKLDDTTEFSIAAGVPMAAASEGAFQNILYGKFFPNEKDTACMLSLDMAKRFNESDPKSLIGRSLTLNYAARAETGGVAPPAAVEELPGIDLGGMQVRRVELACPVVGIVEQETGPAIGGGAGASALMLPMAQARAIYAVQVTNTQSLIRTDEGRGYQTVTVKTSGAQHTQDVEKRIKDLGYSAFSLNDLLQGAKRAFLILDIVLALIGSIALAVSSLGIVNTMVMSILERTREIGVMKAIGGSDPDVRRIFLIEASAIGIGGGGLGVLLGWIITRIVNFGVNIYVQRQGGTAGDLFSLPFWLIASAIGFSLLVSLVAGSYPANRAARLDPIQALRHD